MYINRLQVVALLALLATACKTNPIPVSGSNSGSGNSIELSVSDELMVKGAEVNLTTLEQDPNGFKIFASRATDTSPSSSFIDNVAYKYNTSDKKWVWDLPADSPQLYWPQNSVDYPVKLYAVYAPIVGGFTPSLTKDLVRALPFDTKGTGMGNGTTDVLVAQAEVASIDQGEKPVSLPFDHALSRVRVFVTTGTGVTARIQSLRLVNVASKGSYNFATKGYTNLSAFTDFGYLSAANARNVTGVDMSLAGDNGPLFMIPQRTASWVNPTPWSSTSLASGARVEMVYRLAVAASSSTNYRDLVGYDSHASGELFATVSYPLDLVTIPWEAGRAYRCTIKLGTGQDNGGILVNDKFINTIGEVTAVTVVRPDTGDPIENGTPVLGDAPIGFGVDYEAFGSILEDVDHDDTISSVVLTPAEDWLDLTSAVQSREITITGADWTSSIFGSGLTVTPTSGVSGAKATLAWTANTFPSARTARVRFTATGNGFGSTLLRTSQRGVLSIIPAGDWADISALGATRKVRVFCAKWTAVATGDGLTIDKTSGESGDELTLTLAPNYGKTRAVARTGTVEITEEGGDTQTITTTQLAGSFVFSPAGDWSDVTAEGDVMELTITGAPTWTAVLENAAGGLTLSKALGKDGEKITLTWASNVAAVAPASRSGKLTITGSNDLGDIVFNTTQLGAVTPVPTGEFVAINGVNWAVGNLVAKSATAGPAGEGALKIGAPTDGGLYFPFGSLIGTRGGSLASGGTGEGSIDATWKGKVWGGVASYAKTNDMLIWPTEFTTKIGETYWYTSTVTSGNVALNYFFNYTKAPYNVSVRIDAFDELAAGKTLIEGGYANKGVGDACRYYLGAPWRLPNMEEINGLNTYVKGDVAKRQGAWPAAAPFGRWVGENAALPTKSIFIPASGRRTAATYGTFDEIDTKGYALSYESQAMYNMNTMQVHNIDATSLLQSTEKESAVPVRCVYANQ